MELENFPAAVINYQKALDMDKSLGVETKLETAKTKKIPNYYKVLEVNSNATREEINTAYKKLMLAWHPDKNGENDTMRVSSIHIN